jgi:hypothetical protein
MIKETTFHIDGGTTFCHPGGGTGGFHCHPGSGVIGF